MTNGMIREESKENQTNESKSNELEREREELHSLFLFSFKNNGTKFFFLKFKTINWI
jgi:hypothetical protein